MPSIQLSLSSPHNPVLAFVTSGWKSHNLEFCKTASIFFCNFLRYFHFCSLFWTIQLPFVGLFSNNGNSLLFTSSFYSKSVVPNLSSLEAWPGSGGGMCVVEGACAQVRSSTPRAESVWAEGVCAHVWSSTCTIVGCSLEIWGCLL